MSDDKHFETSRDNVKDKAHTDYNRDIDAAKAARNNQKNDTNPYIEKEGYLGVDDLDKMRRRAVK